MNVSTSCIICKRVYEVDVRIFNDRPCGRCTDCQTVIDETRGDAAARILDRLGISR